MNSENEDAKKRFPEFWAVYPKKIGKPLAQSKWNHIVNGGLKTRTLDRDSQTFVEIELKATPDEIILAAKKYSDRNFNKSTYRFKDDGKYLCHPATWLNQGRWMDEN